MIVTSTKTFIKDVKRINDRAVKDDVIDFLNELRAANNLSGFSNIKPMVKHSGYFRKRFGNYRLGFKIIKRNGVLEAEIMRLMHRSKIYQVFP